MTIKKQFVELISFLEANEGKKVSTIMDEIYSMVESKKRASTSIKDADGNVIAIYCYYHKQWEVVAEVEYGSKASSATGLDTMCKVGVSKWTKAQRDAKKANSDLLTKVASGEIEPSDILTLQAEIEANRTTMNVEDMPQGFASEDEVLQYLS